MKSRVVSLTLVYFFFFFALLTGTDAGLPKWSILIAVPPPAAAPLRSPIPELASPEVSTPASPSELVLEAPRLPAPAFPEDPTESPEVSALVLATVQPSEYPEYPETSAAPGAPVPATSLSEVFAPRSSPCTSVKATPKSSASPVSALDLLDAISNSHDEHKHSELEIAVAFATPAVSAEPELELEPQPLPTTLSQPQPLPQPHDGPYKRACFPSHARVTLRGGTRSPIAQLQVGDHVESAPGHFSPVLLHTHADTEATTLFVVLRTRRGSEIAASPGHYLVTSGGRLRVAGEFRVHDDIRTASGADRVISVRHAMYRGLHNPQTASGAILVRLGDSGAVQASTYTSAVFPNAAHAALSPLRAVQKTFGVTFGAQSWVVCDDAVVRFTGVFGSGTSRLGGASRSTELWLYVCVLGALLIATSTDLPCGLEKHMDARSIDLGLLPTLYRVSHRSPSVHSSN